MGGFLVVFAQEGGKLSKKSLGVICSGTELGTAYSDDEEMRKKGLKLTDLTKLANVIIPLIGTP